MWVSVVTDLLDKRGVTFEVIPHDQAYTSIAEATALGISADEVLKALVLDTASGNAIAVVPGSRRLDMRSVEKAVGAKHVRLATEEEIEKSFPGYELGAVPPMGSLFGIQTFVDPEVIDHETVVFAAGSQTESVKLRTEDLFRDEPVMIAALTRYSVAGEEPSDEEGP
jgi:Ala-tRNA(Pro) deacylase